MKRTRTIRLVLMGISPLILTACNPSVQGGRPQPGEERLYPNAEACIASGDFSRADCTAAFASAQEEHLKTAPQFNSREECVAQHGESGCMQSGHSSFMPFMAGMLMGRAFNAGYARPAYLDRGPQQYQGGNGNYWSGGSNPVRQPGAAPLPPPPPGKIITARSGFGGNSAHSGG